MVTGTILLRAGLFTQLLPVKIPADRYEMDFWINAEKNRATRVAKIR